MQSIRTSTSTWAIIRGGSLDDVVTCESSIDSDSDHAVVAATPLILRRHAPDSGPCEITILFTQKHQIKQVYVRSTARVYEIYCAADDRGGNEYLCTVRCGIAAREEDQQQGTDAVECVSNTSSGSNQTQDEGHSRTESGSSSNEDGWVDVKLNTSIKPDTGYNSLLKKKESCMVQDIQDRFEATAEISDADPVLSITVRLLSIQSGDDIFIDEVYLFADAAVSADINSSTASLETSSGSAMLSMFIPTLLQMSKSRMNNIQDHRDSSAGKKSMNQDYRQSSTGAAVICSTLPTEVTPSTMHEGASAQKYQQELPTQTSNPHLICSKDDAPCSKIERTLDELVSRVSKIEDLFLRFEETMLKPITNIETRLDRVEQQLESFGKHAQFPRTGCTRYYAPEFSCIESESNSIYTGGNYCPANATSESSKNDDGCLQQVYNPASDGHSCTTVQLHDLKFSTSTSHLLPSLVVTAPDFSNVDDEEDNEPTEAIKDSAKVNSRRPMSIDDALASALAGFASLALTKPLECTDMVEKAEIFSGVEGTDSNSVPGLLKSIECTEMVEAAENVCSVEGSVNSSLSPLLQSDECELPPVDIDGGNTSSINAFVTEEHFAAISASEETTGAIDGHDHVLYEVGRMKPLGSFNCTSVDGLGKTEKSGSVAGNRSAEPDDETGQTIVCDYCDTPTLVDSASSKDIYVAAVDVPGSHIDSSSGQGITNDCPAVLQDILELPSSATVDFNVSVLDVEFLSLGDSSRMSSLEDLLDDMPDLVGAVPRVRGDNASSYSEQHDLVIIENEESGDPDTSNSQLLCFNNFDSVYMPSETEEELQDRSESSNQDLCASLI